MGNKIIDLNNVENVCVYPGCKSKEANYRWELSTGIGEDRLSIKCCMYHSLIISNGDFNAERINETTYELLGPFIEVSLIEQVMAAREVSKKGLAKDLNT